MFIAEFLKIPNDFVNELTKSTIALFVVIDPIGSVPLFVALTNKMDKHQRKKTSELVIITAASLLIMFAIINDGSRTWMVKATGVCNYCRRTRVTHLIHRTCFLCSTSVSPRFGKPRGQFGRVRPTPEQS